MSAFSLLQQRLLDSQLRETQYLRDRTTMAGMLKIASKALHGSGCVETATAIDDYLKHLGEHDAKCLADALDAESYVEADQSAQTGLARPEGRSSLPTETGMPENFLFRKQAH